MKPAELQIIASGMCCSVGYSVAAASAAVRAAVDNFRETDFREPDGNLLIGTQLYQADVWGTARFVEMFENALAECLSRSPFVDFSQTPLLLLLSEQDRPGADHSWIVGALSNTQYRFHEKSAVFFDGRAGVANALLRARNLLTEHNIAHVVIIGVDSYFTLGTINYYLSANRLLTDKNSDGFIPGEGAGAIVVCRAAENMAGLKITGIGTAYEDAHILRQDRPNRAQGLSTAIGNALKEAGCPLSRTHFHIGDVSGEAYYFREISLALTRCFDEAAPDYPHLGFANAVGETGAAVGPLILAYLNDILRRDDRPGTHGLVHFSSDAGQRAALVAEYQFLTTKAD